MNSDTATEPLYQYVHRDAGKEECKLQPLNSIEDIMIGPADKAEAKKILNNKPSGTFLLRRSIKSNKYVVSSVRESKNVSHYTLESKEIKSKSEFYIRLT